MIRRQQQKVGSTREYRVQLTAVEVYEIVLKAADEDRACEDAEHMWAELGPEAFAYRDGRLDDVSVVSDGEVRP